MESSNGDTISNVVDNGIHENHNVDGADTNGVNGVHDNPEVCHAEVAGAPESNEGHYLVAANDIQAGQFVISEYPIVTGPLYTRSKPVCLQCLKKLTGPDDVVICERCKAPLCSLECSNGKWHALECKVLQKAGYEISIQNWEADCPIYSCITILRALLLEQANPAHWKILQTFMDHDQDRTKKDSPTWKIHEKLVFSFISGNLELNHIDQVAIRRMIGVIRTNAVKLETRAGYGEGVALYPTYTYANHNCMCNTHTRKHKDLRLDLIAHSDINKGETIWTRYTTPQIGNFQRVEDIQKTWHFTCTCARCSDPTEFGTMMSGLICGPECQGILLPLRSTLVGSPWGCSVCKRKLGVLAVQKIVKEVIDQIGDKRNSSNEELISLILELSGSKLHPNHYLLIGIKEILLQRMMWCINNKTNYAGLSHKEKVDCLELRTKLFSEIVEILTLVDSKGAPWKEKLEKMRREEEGKKAEILENNQEN